MPQDLVTHEQPFDSVLSEFDKVEQRAVSGIYVLPIVFAIIALVPLAVFIAMTFVWNVPPPFCLIPLLMLAVLGGVTAYLFRKLRRYRIARAALHAWAQARGFVGGVHLRQKPRTQEEAILLLDSGFNAMMQTYCRDP